MPQTYPDLSDDHGDALEAFAAGSGAGWRDDLLDGWMRAAFPGPLQRIRNVYGPTWLFTVFRLAGEPTAPA